MNYADIVTQNYPAYRLTRIGSGNTYEELEWSTSNPLPNPIPKATLDADLNEYAVNGWVGAGGDLDNNETLELVAFAQLPSTPGLVYKVDHRLYKLDTNVYLTSITSTNVTNALGYTPYSDTNPNLYTTKSYVDGLASSGIKWIEPAEIVNLVGGTNTPPVSPIIGDAYIIYTGGNTGAWSTFDVGDLVQFQNQGLGWVQLTDVLDLAVGMRFIIGATTVTPGVGFALGKDNQLATITGGVGGPGENITWSFELVADNSAVFVLNELAEFFGSSYLYNLADDEWILFQSSATYSAGDGLSLTGTTFNVNSGPGTVIVNDTVAVDLYSTSGLMTTVDGTNSSTNIGSQLSLTKTGIAPGIYNAVTVDAHGRITAGTNPTTLAGHGIIDAQPLDADLTSIATLAGTSGYLKKTAADTWALDTSLSIVSDVSVVTANGLAGTVATSTTTPAITLSTTVTGMVKGDGTSFSAAIPGVDYIVVNTSTGQLLQAVHSHITAISGTTTKIDADTSPVITDGTQIWALDITPTLVASRIAIYGSFYCDCGTNNRRVVVALWRTTGGIDTLVGVSAMFVTASGNGGEISISFVDEPASTSLCTYSMRAWINNAGTWYIARGATLVFNGELAKQVVHLQEIS